MYRIKSCVVTCFSPICVALIVALVSLSLLATSAVAQETKVNVSGKVLDQAGLPLSDATIQFEFLRVTGGLQESVTCKSDEQGQYTLPETIISTDTNLIHGIRVAKRGFAIAQVNLSKVEHADCKVIPQDGRVNIDFTLAPSAELQIRIQDADGNPVSNAVLASLASKSPSRLGMWVQLSDWKTLGREAPTSNQDGIMIVDCLAAQGTFDFGFEHPDFARTNLWSIQRTEAPISATLEEGEPITFKVVCESNPAALADAKVNIAITETGGHAWRTLDFDELGICSTRLANRPTSIRVEHPTLFSAPIYQYQHKPNQELRFDLLEKGTLIGKVIDQETQKPIEGVSVSLHANDAHFATTSTDTHGRYELIGPAANLALYFEGQDWEPGQLNATVIANKVQSLPDLGLKKRKREYGKVVLASGAPVPRAIVVSVEQGHAVQLADENGRFELSQGMSAVHAIHPYEELSRIAMHIPVEVEKRLQKVLNGEPEIEELKEEEKPVEKEFSIELATEGNLIGIVVDEQKQPLADIPVQLETQVFFQLVGNVPNGGIRMRVYSTQTRADGSFRFRGLSRGAVFQALVHGKATAAFDSDLDLRSKQIEVGEIKIRKPLVASASLAAELSEVTRLQAHAQLPKKLEQLDVANWLGGKSQTMSDLKGKKVLLCFLPLPELEPFIQAHDLYADKGLVVIGIYPTREELQQAEATLKEQGIRFPTAIVEVGSPLERSYQVDREIYAVAYDSTGQLAGPIYGRRNELLEIRNFMLYGR